MELNEEPVRYLTKADVEAFKEQEHRERVALAQRVERGELTAEEANREASIFKGKVPTVLEVPINYKQAAQNLIGARKKRHGRGR
jgi:hypothetical protein